MCFRFAYSFHMPLFIMISGYLFNMTRIAKKWDFLPMLKEKWLRLGIPYIVFIILAMVIKLFYHDGRPLDMSAVGIISNFTHPFEGALQEMWFVAVLAVYFVCYPVYPYLLRQKWVTWTVLTIGSGMFFIPMGSMTNFLALDRVVHFFVFFFTGIAISRWKWERYITHQTSVAVTAALFIVATIFDIPLLLPMSGSLVFWGLSVWVDRKVSSGVFHTFRDYTYQIFLIGIFGQIAVKFLYRRFAFDGSYILWWCVCILVGVYLPVLIARLIRNRRGRAAVWIKRCVGL